MRHMVTSHLSRLYQTISETCGRGRPRTSTSRPSLRHSCAMSCAAWNSCGSAACAPDMSTSLRTRSPCASAMVPSAVSAMTKARPLMTPAVGLRMPGVRAHHLTEVFICHSPDCSARSRDQCSQSSRVFPAGVCRPMAPHRKRRSVVSPISSLVAIGGRRLSPPQLPISKSQTGDRRARSVARWMRC